MRNTRATRLVGDLLRTYARPLTLQELHDHVREHLPATAYSTVYRIVGRLEEDGRVRRVDWRERGSRFEWSDLPHHHHIVCSLCARSVGRDCARRPPRAARFPPPLHRPVARAPRIVRARFGCQEPEAGLEPAASSLQETRSTN